MSPTGKDKKLTKYNNQNLTYDSIGNPLNYRDGMTMQWLVGRQLYKVNTSDDTVKFMYNADGLRTSKDSNDYTTYYYYDNNNNMIAQKKNGSLMYFQYDCEGNVVSMTFEGSRYYYVKNQQGDIEKIIDHSGNAVVTYKYDAWGKLCNITDTSGQWSIGTMNPFRYRGYIYDDETGLYYLKSRYYDPITGRFLNADDTTYIGFTDTVLSYNIFAYCENNAINFRDPHGCWSIPSDWVANTIDICIAVFGTAIKIAFSAIKVTIKAFLKAYGVRKAAKYLLKKILPAIKKAIVKFIKSINKIILKVFHKAYLQFQIFKVTWFISEFSKLLKNKNIDKISRAITSLLSIGGIIAAILDKFSDKRFDGIIRI